MIEIKMIITKLNIILLFDKENKSLSFISSIISIFISIHINIYVQFKIFNIKNIYIYIYLI